MQKDHAIAKTC